MSDKQTLIITLKTNVSEYKKALSEAQKTYRKDLKSMVASNRERYRENDEKIKTTLRAVKNSGLGFLDLNYLTKQLQAGFITPDI